MPARQVLHVHSAPPSLCPHVERAVARITGRALCMRWAGQPAAPGLLRAELVLAAPPGTAAAVTSALAAWRRLRFEVTEEPTPGCDGARWSYTPGLGTFTAVTGANGDILIPEGRLRAVVAAAAGGSLAAELSRLLGQPWDDELEPFRRAAGACGRWLTAVS